MFIEVNGVCVNTGFKTLDTHEDFMLAWDSGDDSGCAHHTFHARQHGVAHFSTVHQAELNSANKKPTFFINPPQVRIKFEKSAKVCVPRVSMVTPSSQNLPTSKATLVLFPSRERCTRLVGVWM
jgi:hypothetical protein